MERLTAEGLARAADARAFAVEGYVPIGSWRVNLRATRREYAETLGVLLRQEPGSRPPGAAGEIDAELLLVSEPAGGALFPPHDPSGDGRVAGWEALGEGVQSLFTGWFRVVRFEDRRPERIVFFVREPQYSERAFRDHLFEMLCKVLFHGERFYVHAGAVRFGKDVNLFVGEGSFGKTTTCLYLARAGGTILSEDHVVLRRAGADFAVSGCQDTIRVTAKTEAFFFDAPLPITPVDGPGGPKKLFRTADHFEARPFEDFPFRRIFFNRIGERFAITPVSAREAVLRLFHMTRSFYRHNDPGDLDAYLEFFGDLVAGREHYALELSPDLRDLEQLVAFLRG